MSNTINLPISPSTKILVEEGDSITAKTILGKFSDTHEIETIHLAKLLSVANDKIYKYLKKKAGEKVTSGEVIAEKKGFLSSSVVKSPISGKLLEMDLLKGTINLLKYSKEGQVRLGAGREEIISPVSGKVVTIGKTAIEINTNSPIFKGESGEGSDAFGDLKYLEGEVLGILDFHAELEDSIVMCKAVGEATLVKFAVLGVKGMILMDVKNEMALPWISVEENIFGKLKDFVSDKIWLRPGEKQIIILE